MIIEKNKILVLVLLLVISLEVAAESQQSEVVCGNSIQHRGFIIYGQSFPRGTFPWIVALLTNKKDPLAFFCGGTLVSLNHVITGDKLDERWFLENSNIRLDLLSIILAAHCIKPKNGFPFPELQTHEIIAYFGAHDLNDATEKRITASPSNIRVHHDWDPNIQRYDADIAMLVFGNGKIEFTKSIQPICLLFSDDKEWDEGIVAGWGQSEDSSKRHETIPKQVKLKKSSDCVYDAPILAHIGSNRTFCAGLKNGSGVCVGDSGNGFFVFSKNVFHLAGIVSSSANTPATSCDVTKNAIYTDVSKFKIWINRTLTETFNTSSEEGTYCKLPNTTDHSICMRLRHCDSLFTFVKSVKTALTTDQRAYLEQYICGKKLACCPDNVVPRRSLIRFDGVPGNPHGEDLKNHSNFGKINEKNCGKVFSDRIVGGRKVKAGEFPWMALLQYRVGLDELLIFNCGGSLITLDYILTSASCINEDLVSVRLGQLVLSTSSTNKDCSENAEDCDDPIQDIPVERRIVHPRYDSTKLINNVALLKLQSSADVKVKNVKTICLPTDADQQYGQIEEDFPLLISGYGSKDKRSKFPLKTFTSYVTTDDCADRLSKNNYNVYASNFCAALTDSLERCPGNKGGSISTYGQINGIFRNFLYGVHSHGVECKSPDGHFPDVYTNVTYYLPWILDNISN